MKACIVALLVVCGLAALEASPCGDKLCPFIYAPICGQNTDLTYTLYNNQCEFDSCGGVSQYSVYCAAGEAVTTAEDCSC